MVHNEFVNIWTHLLGACFIIFLIIYTSIYINSHKKEIYGIIDSKWEKFNENPWGFLGLTYDLPSLSEIKSDIQTKFKDSKIFFNDYVSKIKIKTMNYFSTLDDKLNEYKEFIKEKFNCIDCLGVIISKLNSMKEQIHHNFEELKEKMKILYEKSLNNINNINLQSVNISKFEFDVSKYIEELNDKVHKFKEEVLGNVLYQFIFSWIQNKWNG